MARLTAAARKQIPSSEYGLPDQRAYPMPDRKHAAVAKAYAERYATPAERTRIDAKANRILGKSGSLSRHAARYHKGR